MDPRLAPLQVILDLNVRLFLATFDGVDDRIATQRPNDQTNHMAFIACHLLDARHFLASYAGCGTEKPFKEVLDAERFEDIERFPTVKEITGAWSDISGILVEIFPRLEPSELAKDSPQPFPIKDGSLLGGITFLLEHESYHIGQLGLLRRLFGLPSMKYS